MEHPFMENGSLINITISCGVAQFHSSDLCIEGTIQRADKALYEAKKSGRNQIAVAEAREHRQAIATTKESLLLS
jgi:diguanylate cyclase (GGDEF)-like protein